MHIELDARDNDSELDADACSYVTWGCTDHSHQRPFSFIDSSITSAIAFASCLYRRVLSSAQALQLSHQRCLQPDIQCLR